MDEPSVVIPVLFDSNSGEPAREGEEQYTVGVFSVNVNVHGPTRGVGSIPSGGTDLVVVLRTTISRGYDDGLSELLSEPIEAAHEVSVHFRLAAMRTRHFLFCEV